MATNRSIGFWIDLLLVILRAIRDLFDDDNLEEKPSLPPHIKVP